MIIGSTRYLVLQRLRGFTQVCRILQDGGILPAAIHSQMDFDGSPASKGRRNRQSTIFSRTLSMKAYVLPSTESAGPASPQRLAVYP